VWGLVCSSAVLVKAEAGEFFGGQKILEPHAVRAQREVEQKILLFFLIFGGARKKEIIKKILLKA